MSRLSNAWKNWLKISHIIGNFQGQVILTIFYFVLLWPVGIVIRVFSDPLNLKAKKNKNSTFDDFEYRDETIREASHPY